MQMLPSISVIYYLYLSLISTYIVKYYNVPFACKDTVAIEPITYR